MKTDIKSKTCNSLAQAVNWIKIQYANYPDNSILSSWTDSTQSFTVAYVVINTDSLYNHKIQI
jgi:hypothetical protein